MFLPITTELRGLCPQVFEAQNLENAWIDFKTNFIKKKTQHTNTVNMNTEKYENVLLTMKLSESTDMLHTGGLSCGFGNDCARVIEKSFQHVLFLRQETTSRRSSIPVSSIHTLFSKLIYRTLYDA